MREVGWLERYWLLYVLAYPAALLGLGLGLRPAWGAIEVWAALITVSFGMASGVALLSEGALMVMLPALAKIKKLKDEGRQEGRLEERRKWVAWKEAAERAGVVFPEPSPAERDDLKS